MTTEHQRFYEYSISNTTIINLFNSSEVQAEEFNEFKGQMSYDFYIERPVLHSDFKSDFVKLDDHLNIATGPKVADQASKGSNNQAKISIKSTALQSTTSLGQTVTDRQEPTDQAILFASIPSITATPVLSLLNQEALEALLKTHKRHENQEKRIKSRDRDRINHQLSKVDAYGYPLGHFHKQTLSASGLFGKINSVALSDGVAGVINEPKTDISSIPASAATAPSTRTSSRFQTAPSYTFANQQTPADDNFKVPTRNQIVPATSETENTASKLRVSSRIHAFTPEINRIPINSSVLDFDKPVYFVHKYHPKPVAPSTNARDLALQLGIEGVYWQNLSVSDSINFGIGSGITVPLPQIIQPRRSSIVDDSIANSNYYHKGIFKKIRIKFKEDGSDIIFGGTSSGVGGSPASDNNPFQPILQASRLRARKVADDFYDDDPLAELYTFEKTAKPKTGGTKRTRAIAAGTLVDVEEVVLARGSSNTTAGTSKRRPREDTSDVIEIQPPHYVQRKAGFLSAAIITKPTITAEQDSAVELNTKSSKLRASNSKSRSTSDERDADFVIAAIHRDKPKKRAHDTADEISSQIKPVVEVRSKRHPLAFGHPIPFMKKLDLDYNDHIWAILHEPKVVL